MKNFLARLRNVKRTTLIRNSFLLPILSVVVMSISHVISWYDLGNPFSWAIYLSIAVEVFALASVSAASIKMKKTSIWLLFVLVTLIQIVGNVFFTFQDIDVNGYQFKSWVDLVSPWFEDWESIDHKRLLALIQGGTLPFMSLIALHFYIKFNENLGEEGESSEKVSISPVEPSSPVEPVTPQILSTEDVDFQEPVHEVEEVVEDAKEETKEPELEKKPELDQIHISDTPVSEEEKGSRRRLHPARY